MTRLPNPLPREEQQLRDLLNEAVPRSIPSTSLSERIAEMAAQADAKRHFETTAPSAGKRTLKPRFQQPRFQQPRFRLVLTVATALFFFSAASLMWPRLLTTQALARVEAAMAKVSSAHMVNWRVVDGKRVKSSETWFQNGKWRLEDKSSGQFMLYKEGRSWNYDPTQNTVTVASKPGDPFAHNSSGFTLSAMVRDLESRGSQTKLSLNGEQEVDGVLLNRMSLEIKTDYETTTGTIWVNPETDLPVRFEWTSRTRYGKQASGEMQVSFNEPLQASLFNTNFKSPIRLVDLAREQRNWQSKLQKGLASKSAGERTITINDVQVNGRGAVFVLYTAGKKSGDAFSDGENQFAGRDWRISLSDSLGTRYERVDTGEFISAPFNQRQLKGARLEGDWWVPVEAPIPGTPWRSRTFTLQFELNPKNLHGPQNSSKKWPANYSMERTFEVPVSVPCEGLVPEVMKVLGAGLTDQTVLQREAVARNELPLGQKPSPELVRALKGNGQEWYVSYSPDGQLVASDGGEGLHLWNAQSGRLVRELEAPVPSGFEPVEAPVFSPDGQTVAAAYEDRRRQPEEAGVTRFFLWSVTDGKPKANWATPASGDLHIRNFTFSPDGQTLHVLADIVTQRGGGSKNQFFNRENGLAQERDARTGTLVQSQTLPHDGFIMSGDLVGRDDSNWQIITAQSGDTPAQHKARLWDGDSGKLLYTLPLPPLFHLDASAIGKTAQGTLVAIAGTHYELEGAMQKMGAHEVLLFDGETGQLLRSFNSGSPWIASMAFSPDGTQLACEGDTYQVNLWDTTTGKLNQSLTGHYSALRRLRFAPDGKQLATLDNKGKLLQWKLD